MNNVLFLKPFLIHSVWGGNKLSKYNIDIKNSKDIGEAWIISGCQDKSAIINNGEYKNKTLAEVFTNHKELFDHYEKETYPLLVKFLDCNDKLSIQVHPIKNHPKNECWYFLEAGKNANIVYGHKAKTKKEFVDLVKNKNWNKLLKYKKVKANDVVYVPTGCLHSLNEHLLVYEVQQAVDITYRLYDYDRNCRPIHTKEAIANTIIPFVEPKIKKDPKALIKCRYFELVKIVNTKTKKYTFNQARWIQATVIKGKGLLNNKSKINKGTSFIIPSDSKEFTLSGNLTLLISYVTK